MGFKKARQNMGQVNSLLSDLAKKVEPRSVDSQSARSEYAIEHPLVSYRSPPSDKKRALNQFYESVRYYQDGNELKALNLYNEATKADPSLHKNARETLLNMLQNCSSTDEGAIYYWLGIHSEWLLDWRMAVTYYDKAVNAFYQIGYKNWASRACNNLGSAKMQMRDSSAMEEFEKAIALNPKNGMAYISIGTTYYRISNRGDPRFDKALDAFANAIIINPTTYGPVVMSRLHAIGYTWKEDWEDITRRVVSRQSGIRDEGGDPGKKLEKSKDSRKRRIGFATGTQIEELGESKGKQKKGIGFKSTMPVEKPKKTYRNEKNGFEIDIPEEWQPFPIPILKGSPKDLFQYGCHDEAFNFEIGSLFPEPLLEQTERDFVQFAMFRGFSALKIYRITVGGKEHVCASYHLLDAMGERWNKKYMIVFGKTEYAITATCNDPKWFAQREKDWDVIVQSFRLLGSPI